MQQMTDGYCLREHPAVIVDILMFSPTINKIVHDNNVRGKLLDKSQQSIAS